MAQENEWESTGLKAEGWETVRPRMQPPSIYAPPEQWAEFRAAQRRGEAAPSGYGSVSARPIMEAPSLSSIPGGVAKTLVGTLLETPATLATGAVATPVAGMAGLGRAGYALARGEPMEQAVGRGADVVQRVQQAMTYQPRTEAGQAMTALAAAPFEAAAQGAGAVGGAVGEAVAGPRGRLAGEAIGATVPEVALTLAGGAQQLRARQPTGPVQFTQPEQALRAAQQAGFRALPTEARGGPMNVAVESISKQAPLVKRLVNYNEERASQLVRQELGLPTTGRLDDPALQTLRDQAGAVYDQVRALPDVIDVQAVNPNWTAQVIDLDSRFRSIKNVMPAMYRDGGLERLRGSLGQINQLTPEQIVDITKNLRDTATRNLKRPDAPSEVVDAAYAFKDAANLMEDVLEAHLSQTGRQGALERFRRARELYAKTYTVEDATNLVTGKVDPQALRRAMERGEPLTGNLRRIAEAAATMPSVVRKSEGMITPEGMVLSDWAMGAGIPAAIFSGQPGIAAGLAAGAAARPVVRTMAAGGPYQRAMAQPRGTVPRPPISAAAPGFGAAGIAAQPQREPFTMGEEEQ